jgi:peptidoglycan/LPS O-acetylase OafA/YrhL
VVLISPLFLTQLEMKDLLWQAIGALTFTSNVVLWQQAGYFGGEASLKPLLHTWSLAIEEQFYIFLPLLLVSLKGKVRLAAIVTLTLLSFASAVYLRESASAAFYLLPTRAWELLLGVAVAIFVTTRGLLHTPKLIYFGLFFAIIAIPFFELVGFHPGPQAALLCFATAIILASQPREFRIPGINFILYIGAISYSLYLVHWPLLAFLNNMNFSVPWRGLDDVLIRVTILTFSFVIAALLHRFVEERFRNGLSFNRNIFLISVVPATVFVALLLLSTVRSTSGEDTISTASQVCETSGSFSLEDACRSGGVPRILVWGDSYAMHLVPGLADARSSIEAGIVHATRSACGPFIGVAQTKTVGGYNRRWAEACIGFNDSVIEALSLSDTIDVVVLSSPFSYLINNPEGLFVRSLSDNETRLQPASFDSAMQALSHTVESLRAIGKRVVLVAPPPSGGFDMGRCGRRLVQGLPILGVNQDCQFERTDADASRSESAQLLAAVSQRYNVDVIQMGNVTCSATVCESVVDQIPLYVDGGHLSREGSVWIASQMDLRNAVWNSAR